MSLVLLSARHVNQDTSQAPPQRSRARNVPLVPPPVEGRVRRDVKNVVLGHMALHATIARVDTIVVLVTPRNNAWDVPLVFIRVTWDKQVVFHAFLGWQLPTLAAQIALDVSSTTTPTKLSRRFANNAKADLLRMARMVLPCVICAWEGPTVTTALLVVQACIGQLTMKLQVAVPLVLPDITRRK